MYHHWEWAAIVPIPTLIIITLRSLIILGSRCCLSAHVVMSSHIVLVFPVTAGGWGVDKEEWCWPYRNRAREGFVIMRWW